MLIFAAILFLLPSCIGQFYSTREYEMTFSDNLEKWKVAKLIGIFLAVGIFIGQVYSVEYNTSRLLGIVIWPGVWMSLIIYTKPFGEVFLNDASEYKKVGLLEDAAFIVGWIGVLFQTAKLIILF
ncbi:hypothetical protein AMS58_20965 [Pseudoalteromonas porphyrae]|uniref:Uncharacterized protein n=1 Tax=Pseudoalteromonas porphyrae TaxID=187330 RepID=A0A0N0LVA7_9GAMM|nr:MULTISPECIES: hypothetical protein [Pseudoalteromonas]KPH58041.1 hypothetical protein ADS77_18505 [Pseudoalteromonas porphyrae]KPH91953.1 hypothetical protein AMS58_20965 [Pseudoalteromonas porphyrae]